MWLLLEYFYFDTSNQLTFSTFRLLYWGVLGVIRAVGTIQRDPADFDSLDQTISNETWKTMKVWFWDVLSWAFIIWVFGRSIM